MRSEVSNLGPAGQGRSGLFPAPGDHRVFGRTLLQHSPCPSLSSPSLSVFAMLSASRRINPQIRRYATAVAGQPKAPLSGLNDAVRAKAEELSVWQGTSATGGKTKNFIGGSFVDSHAETWIDVVDPVCLVSFARFIQVLSNDLAVVNPNFAHSCSGDHEHGVQPGSGRSVSCFRIMASNERIDP